MLWGDDTQKKLKGRKGVELTMNLIIIAVILLVVMIVMIAIFTGKMGGIRKSLNTTESQYSQERCEVPGTDRTCITTESACEGRGGFVYQKPSGGKWSDCMWGQVCCSQ